MLNARRHSLPLALYCLACALLTSSHLAISAEWEYQGEKDGVTLYWREFPNSPLPEFKAQTTIAAPIASVLGVLLDIEACPQWVHQCESAVILAQPSPHQRIVYQINKVPFAKDRDIVLLATLQFEDGGNIVTINIENANNYCSDKTTANCEEVQTSTLVRISNFQGQYRLQSLDTNTGVTWQQHLDLGGKLPGWIVRSKLDDLAYQSLSGLSEQAKKAPYQQLQIHIDGNILSVSQTEP